MRDVLIRQFPVELFKVLKFEGLVGSGGEAKAAIEQGLVTVNGQVETQKRKKLQAGDAIGFSGETIRLVGEQSPSDQPSAETGPDAQREKKPPGKPARAAFRKRPPTTRR